MTPTELASALIQSVKAQGFENTPDSLAAGAPIAHFPSIDLAVIAFTRGQHPVAANVLFSREYPDGIVASCRDNFGAIDNVRYLADVTNEAHQSIAWRADADWSRIAWPDYIGSGTQRFVAPYPASLIKLMVLIGVARCIDAGRCGWDTTWAYDSEASTVRVWAERMIVISCNRATSAMVALLHQLGAIVRDANAETHNQINLDFAAFDLPSLRLSETRADGGWTNAAGAGVGNLQMTAWDTVRLLWLLDEDAPAAPWLVAGQSALLSAPTRREVRAILEHQALHEVLSSTVLAGVAGWRAGIPAQLAASWINSDGGVDTDDHNFPPDVRATNLAATVRFAHKTGTTENYLSDAGIVRGIAPARRHYLIAMTSNLGSRYAPDPVCATDWRVPQLGAAIDAYLAAQLE